MEYKDLFSMERERERFEEFRAELREREELVRPFVRTQVAQIRAECLRRGYVCPLYAAQLGRIVGRNSPKIRSVSDIADWILSSFRLEFVGTD